LQAKFFFTLEAHDRAIDPRFIEIQDFDPRQPVADPSRMEEGTGHLALLASGAGVQVDFDQQKSPNQSSISKR
jgi:hypothetical protein